MVFKMVSCQTLTASDSVLCNKAKYDRRNRPVSMARKNEAGRATKRLMSEQRLFKTEPSHTHLLVFCCTSLQIFSVLQ